MLSYLVRKRTTFWKQGKVFFKNANVGHKIIKMDVFKNIQRLFSSVVPIETPIKPVMKHILNDLDLSKFEIPGDNSAELDRSNHKQNSLRPEQEGLQRPLEEEFRSYLGKLSRGNADEKTLELINFTKALLLLEKENNYLRRAFINTWNAVEDQKWINSAENHKRFIKKIGTSFLNYNYYQQMLTSSGNINTWDSDILIESLRILEAQVPFDIINELELIKSNMRNFTEESYHGLWRQISILLLELDIPTKEVDELKPSIISQPTQQLSQKLDLQVRVLKDWGQKAFKEGLLKESVEYYSKAIYTPGISYDELCELYYTRAAVHRVCNDNSSAERDVSCALYFRGLAQKVKN